MMSLEIFYQLARFQFGQLISAEDFADKFHYQITNVILVILLGIVGVRQYVFTPIQCWMPHEWANSWEEFSENYCWVQNTYYSSIRVGPQKIIEDRNNAKINYYQWVPFFLGAQMITFFLPHFLWLMLSARLGTDVNQMVCFAGECTTIDQEKKKQMISFLAKELQVVMDSKRDYRTKGFWKSAHDRCSRIPCFLLGKRSGAFLFTIYLLIKVLYVGVGVANLYMMRDFLGLPDVDFGWNVLLNLTRGGSGGSSSAWEISGHFPRVTWCDIPRMTVGNHQTNSIMCVLPLNMINEKIFIFLWFWISAGSCFMLMSMCMWICRLGSTQNRRVFIKKYLRLLGAVQTRDKDLNKIFVRNFLQFDGIFLLKMIALNAGELVAAELVAEVWRNWCRDVMASKEQLQEDMPPFGTPRVVLGGSHNSTSRQHHGSSRAIGKNANNNSGSRRRPLPDPNAPPMDVQDSMVTMTLAEDAAADARRNVF